MKRTLISLLLIDLFLVAGCDKKDQIIVNQLVGSWKISEINYSIRGSNSIDSTVTYSKAQVDFGGCELSSSIRECYGYYTLTGNERTAISYGITVSENTVNIFPVDQKNVRGMVLWGSYQIEKPKSNILIVTGPASYIDQMGKVFLAIQDIKLTLTR